MPTECERSGTSLEAQPQQLPASVEDQAQQQQQQAQTKALSLQLGDNNDIMDTDKTMDMNGEMSTSQTSNTSSNGCNGSGRKTSLVSPDPTAYVAKARVTRPTPPPPSYNPMQFVQIKPCNLYQTAQQQLKKAEEVKKIKEIKKEEPEDWQCNLDNWKSSRRKRVEHIIDRVVEVKKLELEEHDRSRRKSKTFSEMIEERGERGRTRTKLASLAVYNEDESNDLSDLGIGTSSASGKSSQSEDYDNNSVMSDNADLEKAIFDNNHKANHNNHNNTSTTNGSTREYISSPGYDTSSSTAPASSPDPCEYTYEGAIQDYKQRVSRATSVNANHSGGVGAPLNGGGFKIPNGANSKESTPERGPTTNDGYPTRRGSKIEDRLIGFEVTSPSDNQEGAEKNKIAVDVPKIDISKRKEIFENQKAVDTKPNAMPTGVPKVTLRDRFKFVTPNGSDATEEKAKKEVKRMSGDICSIRERLQSLEQQQNLVNSSKTNVVTSCMLAAGATSSNVDMPPVAPLKDRLSSLQNAVTKEVERKPPVSLIDARQLEIMKNEEETAQQRMKQMGAVKPSVVVTAQDPPAVAPPTEEKDRNDSGIHIEGDADSEQQKSQLLQQEEQLNAAIAALAMEEQQLEAAANAVNQIEAEFAELSATNSVMMPALASGPTTNEPSDPMEFSINEALELALEAIDNETSTTTTIMKATQKMTTATATSTTIMTTKMTKTIEDEDNNKNTVTLTVNSQEVNEQQQQQQFIIKSSNLQHKDDENNRTDEEKELKTKLQQQQQQLNASNANEEDDDQLITPSPTHDDDDDDEDERPIEADDEAEEDNDTEQKIAKEPIYENISATSTYELDAVTKIIPNNNNNSSNNNNDNVSKEDMIQQKPLPLPPTHTQGMQRPMELPPKEQQQQTSEQSTEPEPYYQVPKSSEPYYDAPKHVRPVPLYENIDVFYNGLESATLAAVPMAKMEPPKEKPPPPPVDSPPLFDDDVGDDNVDGGGIGLHNANTDTWSSENTYETISSRHSQQGPSSTLLPVDQPSPPIKRMNSTKRIKKELRNKRSSFLGIEGSAPDDEDSYLEYIVAPPPDMAQLLQEERRLEKQLYMKAGLCDSSDTGESRDSGVSENHSRQSSEPYTNSSEELDRHLLDTPPPHSLKSSTGSPDEMHAGPYHHHADMLSVAAQTPLLQTVKGDSAESWTESATAAAAASQSLTEATATANAKMMSIEEKIREQEEVLRVERELLQLEQEELKRQRENLMLRENMARRELQHGAKMLMSANRRSLQDLNGSALMMAGPMNGAFHQPTQQPPQQQQPQQIYANVPGPTTAVPQHSHYYQVQTDYRKSLSDLNEFSKRLMIAPHRAAAPPTPPSKPMRAMHVSTTNAAAAAGNTTNSHDDYRRHPLMNAQHFGGSLVKIATTPMTVAPPSAGMPRGHIYSNYHHQSVQNLSTNGAPSAATHHGNMTRNTLHALSATPKPKYTDGWVQVQNRKSYDATNLANDPAWLSAYQQKRKSMPDAAAMYQQAPFNNATTNNHWLVQEAEQRRLMEQHQHEQQQQQQQQQQRRSVSTGNTPTHRVIATTAAGNANGNGKPLPDSIIQTLTERVQSKGIGERKRFDKSPLRTNNNYHQHLTQSAHHQQQQQPPTAAHRHLIGGGVSGGNDVHATQAGAVGDATKPSTPPTQDKVLSVSGKKKCSHCGDELGRGAAMIIESLLLFYHINCFKCCVCHVQLGDGLNGTDVRVRNHKLHCQNCYSSDDGIKFSCV